MLLFCRISIPLFCLILLIASACWYRRYRLRQQYIAQQRLNGGNSAAVHFNGNQIAIVAPVSSRPQQHMPLDAYPRQQPPQEFVGYSSPADQALPPYQWNNTLPPSYDDATKQAPLQISQQTNP